MKYEDYDASDLKKVNPSEADLSNLEDKTDFKIQVWRNLKIRLRSLWRWIFGIAILGLLSIFNVPVHLIFLVSAGVASLLLIIKFIKDNVALAREIGWRPMMIAMVKALLVFIPVAMLLLPGFWLGNQTTNWTNRGIERLQVWSAPTQVQETLEKSIETQYEKRVKAKLKWWHQPAVWLNMMDDYVTQTVTETKIVIEVINKAVPQPWHVRAVAGFLKSALAALGVYSMAWTIILALRAYVSLFGRILAAGNHAISFQVGINHESASHHLRKFDAFPLRSGGELELEIEKEEKLFVRVNDMPENALPDLYADWRAGGLLTRLRSGLVFGNRIAAQGEKRVLTFRGAGSFRYISVNLEENQQVVVNPMCMSGFSSGIRFFTNWDFNLAMLALQRPSCFLARGPGRLILKSRGKPNVCNDLAQVRSVDFENLMIFSQNSKFRVEASKGVTNYILSGCRVRPTAGEIFIAAPGSAKNPSRLGKLWQLLKQVYLPI